MPVRMPDVHLADIPRHVRRRKRYIQPSSNALPVHLIHIVHPHRHPRALIVFLISVRLKRSRVRSFSPPTLRSSAKTNLHLARTHRPEHSRRSPTPQLLPPPLPNPL